MQNTALKSLSQVLLAEYAQRRGKRASYSMRSFARQLGIGSSALSEIIRCKRNVSRAQAHRLGSKMGLAPDRLKILVDAFPETRLRRKKSETPRSISYTSLDLDAYHVTSDWTAFAILSLADTEDFNSDPSWIARRLGITKAAAQSMLERLARLDMLILDEQGRLRASGLQYSTSDEVANMAVRRSHEQNLELARTALEKQSLEKRDFTAVTLTVDPARLPEAKRKLREFRDAFCVDMESGARREVYKLCLQFFPLSQEEKIDV